MDVDVFDATDDYLSKPRMLCTSCNLFFADPSEVTCIRESANHNRVKSNLGNKQCRGVVLVVVMIDGEPRFFRYQGFGAGHPYLRGLQELKKEMDERKKDKDKRRKHQTTVAKPAPNASGTSTNQQGGTKTKTANQNIGTLSSLDNDEMHSEEVENLILGNLLYDSGHFEEAIEFFTKAINCDPMEACHYFNRAQCYLKLKDYDNAKSDCNKLIDLVPDHIGALYCRGVANFRSNDKIAAWKDFLEMFRMVDQLETDDDEAKSTTMDIGTEIGQTIDHVQNNMCGRQTDTVAADTLRRKSSLQLEKGDRYFRIGKFKEAIEFYDSAIWIDCSNSFGYVKRAVAYLKVGNVIGCIKDCDDAISLDRTCIQAFCCRAEAFFRIGDKIGAEKDLHWISELANTMTTDRAMESGQELHDSAVKTLIE